MTVDQLISRFFPKPRRGTGPSIGWGRAADLLRRVIDDGESPKQIAGQYGLTADRAAKLVSNWRQRHRDTGVVLVKTPVAKVAPKAKVATVKGSPKLDDILLAEIMTAAARGAYPSLARLEIDLGVRRDVLSTALRRLEGAGLVRRAGLRDKMTITIVSTGQVLTQARGQAQGEILAKPPLAQKVEQAFAGVVYEDDPRAARREPPLRLHPPAVRSSGVASYGDA